MKKRPQQKIQTCDCCLMPDNAGVTVLPFVKEEGENRKIFSYCTLCARHISENYTRLVQV